MSKIDWAPGHKPIKQGPRCRRCKRGWRRPAYDPYCSYHCQEWANINRSLAYVSRLMRQHQLDNLKD